MPNGNQGRSCAPWADMMIEHRSPTGEHMFLWDNVKAGSGPAQLVGAKRDGQLITLELQTKIGSATLVADLERHGLIVEAISKGSKPRLGIVGSHVRFSRFVEVAPGQFFPTRRDVDRLWEDGRPPTSGGSVELSNVQVNLPLEDKAFEVTFPPGTLVLDGIEKKAYRVADDGTWVPDLTIGVGSPAGQGAVPAPRQPARVAASVPGQTPTPSATEPTPWNYWAIAGLLLVGVAGLMLLVWRRRQVQA
ncbi:MAG TPA: hypothetical protein PKD86_02975 [Gemmatales bacterium]|nr:hypothetical protein [Gemmatales bacterium]HMP58295.1 hypothetical protein [Gemmatales bacterium]